MTHALRQSVTLRGGRAHGKVVEVDPLRRTYVAKVSETPRRYAPGEWATADGPAVETTLVEFDMYVRQDDETFVLYEPKPEPLPDGV